MNIVSSELITVAQVTKEFGVYRDKKKKKRKKKTGVYVQTLVYMVRGKQTVENVIQRFN